MAANTWFFLRRFSIQLINPNLLLSYALGDFQQIGTTMTSGDGLEFDL
jgi:hypothetical protein